jgi:hypothetical protein
MKEIRVLALFLLAACAPRSAGDADAPAADAHTRYVFYAHGKIIEDQGPEAVSDIYGPYEYEKILAALREYGFDVSSELRPKDAAVKIYAGRIADWARALIEQGVAPERVTIIGASKGAYIASLAAHELHAPVNLVLLAGCHPATVDAMIGSGIDLPGRVLAIRDRSDTELSGSCRRAFDASPDLVESREIVVDLGVGHGLVYRPFPEWVGPAADWARDSGN